MPQDWMFWPCGILRFDITESASLRQCDWQPHTVNSTLRNSILPKPEVIEKSNEFLLSNRSLTIELDWNNASIDGDAGPEVYVLEDSGS